MKFKQSCLIVFALLFMLAACSDSKKNEDETTGDNDNYSDSDAINDSEVSDEEESDNEIVQDEEPADDHDERAKSPDFEDLECGTSFGDYACDFTLPLDSGDWNFAENYSKDENYILFFYRAMNMTSTKIWQTQLYNLFDKAPDNIHFFFIVDSDKTDIVEEKINSIKGSIQDAYDITGNSNILKKMHVVTKPASKTDPWIAELLKNNSAFFFGIDRERRIRQGGSMSGLDDIYKEAEYYDYEKKMSDFIKEISDKSKIFKGLDNVPFEEEGWTKNIDFEVDFNGLSENGELYIMLEQICDTPKSCEWDRLERLFLCDENGEKCETEIGRWITTYGRSGKWLTDITPLKPLFDKEGKYKFRFTVDGDYYVNNLDFIFINKTDSAKNTLVPLFNQREQFDENYNSHFEPIKIEISDNIKKAKIFAYITGHGNASEEANCAEFCSFESVFTVNGTDFKIRFNKAGTPDGCFEEVVNGVVPNQYGTWPYGRAGWCPGKNVTLLEADISEALTSGENIFSYAAYLNGEIYIPVVTNENGYRAEIYLSSHLALYK
jgi:Peptide-N-glycosidase F, C terminal.